MNLLASIYNYRSNCDFSSFSLSVLTEPMIIAGPSDANINYGDDVTLTCTVFSDEPPVIIWKHMRASERPRSVSTKKPTMTSNNLYDCSLMIINVNSMHNGSYFFNVSNTNGSSTSTTAKLATS